MSNPEALAYMKQFAQYSTPMAMVTTLLPDILEQGSGDYSRWSERVSLLVEHKGRLRQRKLWLTQLGNSGNKILYEANVTVVAGVDVSNISLVCALCMHKGLCTPEEWAMASNPRASKQAIKDLTATWCRKRGLSDIYQDGWGNKIRLDDGQDYP